ncbi:hypothetical protein E2C01_041557 [Portunus trituberculatus]|uniref:Uncharacterized protein n=1 Tax=Portunus trituberculatus TaxID=210409 RepID=A0A5B7FJK2_PORTR|nr:hypothetical protein [Portunus trituberculatus]
MYSFPRGLCGPTGTYRSQYPSSSSSSSSSSSTSSANPLITSATKVTYEILLFFLSPSASSFSFLKVTTGLDQETHRRGRTA